jgi:hypothetical protein
LFILNLPAGLKGYVDTNAQQSQPGVFVRGVALARAAID